jgi:glycosyltransferase 2 family protein
VSVAEEKLLRKPANSRRDWIRMGVIAAVTAVVFIVLFRNVSFGNVVRVLRGSRPLPLALGVLLTIAFPVCTSLRWRTVMKGLGKPVRTRESMSIIMACFTISTFTPSKGGDLGRAWFMRGRVPMSTVLGSVLAERTLDVLTLLAFSLIGSLIFGWRTLALMSGACLAGGILTIAGLLFLRLPVPAKLRPKVDRLLEAMRILLRRPGLLGVMLLFTLGNWCASILQTWLFYRSLGVPAMHIGRICAALPVAIFIGLLPVTIAGMGTRDAALIRLMAGQAPSAVSLGVGLLYSICGYWLPGLAGIPFLRWALRRRAEPGQG